MEIFKYSNIAGALIIKKQPNGFSSFSMSCRQGTNSLSYVISSPHTVYCETYAIGFFFLIFISQSIAINTFSSQNTAVTFQASLTCKCNRGWYYSWRM